MSYAHLGFRYLNTSLKICRNYHAYFEHLSMNEIIFVFLYFRQKNRHFSCPEPDKSSQHSLAPLLLRFMLLLSSTVHLALQ